MRKHNKSGEHHFFNEAVFLAMLLAVVLVYANVSFFERYQVKRIIERCHTEALAKAVAASPEGNETNAEAYEFTFKTCARAQGIAL